MLVSYLPSLDLWTNSGSQWPSTTIKLLLEAITAASVPFAKAVLAQFAVLPSLALSVELAAATLRNTNCSQCQDQNSRQSWTLP